MTIPTLYHYTTHEGLLGILQSHCLWATHCACLNDPDEMNFGRQRCSEVLQKMKGEPNVSKAEMLFKKSIQVPSCYIASFSGQRDLLSQWIAYSHGGTGFAVEFELERHPLAKWLKKVVYDPDEQVEFIREAIAKGRNLADEVVPYLKRPAFAAEQEWRLAITAHSKGERRVRLSNNRLIPFLELKTKHHVVYRGTAESYYSPISAIWVGPKNDFALTKLSVETVLHTLHFHEVKVHEASFRLR